jgi:hypothetical protein
MGTMSQKMATFITTAVRTLNSKLNSKGGNISIKM